MGERGKNRESGREGKENGRGWGEWLKGKISLPNFLIFYHLNWIIINIFYTNLKSLLRQNALFVCIIYAVLAMNEAKVGGNKVFRQGGMGNLNIN